MSGCRQRRRVPAALTMLALLGVLLPGAPLGLATPAANADDAAPDTASGVSLVVPWVDENVLAHRLYREGRHAEAAELFSDPAWKGLALYRSEQWWRAAEAFLRADDPVSAYNLGNCYVRLGYYALALDAYQRALGVRPDFSDAAHNAETMRRLLALGDDGENAGARAPREDEIARVETDDERAPGPGEAGEQDAGADEGSDGDAGRGDTDSDPGAASAGSRGGEGGQRQRDGESEPVSGDDLSGDAGERDGTDRAGGVSETDAIDSSEAAAGLRARLEAEQATEQWLNGIAHDPARFLEKRIRLELRRRQAAGQTAPVGGDRW